MQLKLSQWVGGDMGESNMLVGMKRNDLAGRGRNFSVGRPGSLLAMKGGAYSAHWPEIGNWTLAHVFLLKFLKGINDFLLRRRLCLPA